MPLSFSGKTIRSAPVFFRILLILLFFALAMTLCTPFSLAIITHIMLASRSCDIQTITASIFPRPSCCISSASLRSAMTACVYLPAFSSISCSFLSATRTSAPPAISSSATLMPKFPSPSTANVLFFISGPLSDSKYRNLKMHSAVLTDQESPFRIADSIFVSLACNKEHHH